MNTGPVIPAEVKSWQFEFQLIGGTRAVVHANSLPEAVDACHALYGEFTHCLGVAKLKD